MSTGRVIANALRSFAGDRSEDCPYRDLVLLVELATNDSASRSSLGSGYMPGPFYADRGQQWTQHPSRPLAPPDGPDPAGRRSLLSPRWMRPFKVLARTPLNVYRLDIQATFSACDEFHVEHLCLNLRRPDHLGGDASPLPPVDGGGQR